MQLCLTVRFK